MIKFPVFLTKSTHKDQTGNVVSLAERRLRRQNADDRIIAVIVAPDGSRVRTRPDNNGPDQLVVPLGRTFLSRIYAGRIAIPAKYVIGDAHRGAHGLSLVETMGEVETK